MTSRQFTQWRAFLEVDHVFDAAREDRRFGELWALIASYIRDTKKRSKPYTWTDLFPEHRPPVKRDDTLKDATRMFHELMAVGRALGFGPAPRKD